MKKFVKILVAALLLVPSLAFASSITPTSGDQTTVFTWTSTSGDKINLYDPTDTFISNYGGSATFYAPYSANYVGTWHWVYGPNYCGPGSSYVSLASCQGQGTSVAVVLTNAGGGGGGSGTSTCQTVFGTSTCSSMVVDNPTQDLALGVIIFLMVVGWIARYFSSQIHG